MRYRRSTSCSSASSICTAMSAVDTNRYSVPERFVGKSVAVYKLPAEIHVRRKDTRSPSTGG